jgi:hypothetical protein
MLILLVYCLFYGEGETLRREEGRYGRLQVAISRQFCLEGDGEGGVD